MFGCKYFILKNANDRSRKFDKKSNEGIFLGYSTTSKAYIVYNKSSLEVEESMNMKFKENHPLVNISKEPEYTHKACTSADIKQDI